MQTLPIENVQSKIYTIRGKQVMLDSELAEIYHVETKRLKEQVNRNIERFPDDFMFQLSKEEYEILRSQFATSSWGGRRYMPYVFTEQGVYRNRGKLVLNAQGKLRECYGTQRRYCKGCDDFNHAYLYKDT